MPGAKAGAADLRRVEESGQLDKSDGGDADVAEDEEEVDTEVVEEEEAAAEEGEAEEELEEEDAGCQERIQIALQPQDFPSEQGGQIGEGDPEPPQEYYDFMFPYGELLEDNVRATGCEEDDEDEKNKELWKARAWKALEYCGYGLLVMAIIFDEMD